MSATGKELSKLQRIVLGAAFVPMLATGGAGGYGTYSNIKAAFGSGTAVGAVAAGEGATAVLAIVLLGLTLLGQASPRVIRAGLWALPAAASAMSVTAATTPGEMVIYAITPMGMTASAEGAAFLARRIVVYRDGRDAEAEAHAAAIVQALAYHRARAANHPDEKTRAKSERTSWKLARKVGAGDIALGDRLLDVQRQRVTAGADAALADMFGVPTTLAPTAGLVDELVGLTVELEVDRSTQPIDSAKAEKSAQSTAERSTSDLHVPALTSAAADPDLYDLFEQEEHAPKVAEQSTGRAAVMAADTPVRRRATGRVPQVARSVQPRRTKDELLSEARQLTESWTVDQLTADGIRKALRTSPEKGRWLRDTLKGERGEAA